METERKIRTYGGYFEKFMETLNEKEQEKVQYGLLLLKTQERLSTKFVKSIRLQKNPGIVSMNDIARIFYI